MALLDPATAPPAAAAILDCTGKVVAPGFIDLHSHGAAHRPTARLQALDGVTFQGEFEFGVTDVAAYAARGPSCGEVLRPVSRRLVSL